MSTHVHDVENWNPWTNVLPGAASLLEHIDQRIFVWLRDTRMYVGILRSVDQFANLVLSGASLRIQIQGNVGDIHQGIVMIRGENVALLGEQQDYEFQIGRREADEMLTEQVMQDLRAKRIEAFKKFAYWKRGLIFAPDDYF